MKGRHHVLDTPIELAPHQTVADALSLLPKRAHNAGVVVDEDRRPIGVVTDRDLDGVDRFTQLEVVMSKNLLPLGMAAGVSAAGATALLLVHRLRRGLHRRRGGQTRSATCRARSCSRWSS
ncbi:hypothetical protein SALBM311S_05280 [Streptomyces alboniger]